MSTQCKTIFAVTSFIILLLNFFYACVVSVVLSTCRSTYPVCMIVKKLADKKGFIDRFQRDSRFWNCCFYVTLTVLDRQNKIIDCDFVENHGNVFSLKTMAMVSLKKHPALSSTDILLCKTKLSQHRLLLPTNRIFYDCCRNVYDNFCGLERVKRFENMHLQPENDLKNVHVAPPLNKCLRTPMPTSGVWCKKWFK